MKKIIMISLITLFSLGACSSEEELIEQIKIDSAISYQKIQNQSQLKKLYKKDIYNDNLNNMGIGNPSIRERYEYENSLKIKW